MPEGTLHVELIKAHGLKDVETFGKSDPYAIVSVGHLKHRSRTILGGGSEAAWNQSFLFDIPHGPTQVDIAIFDQERRGGDEAMGTVSIPLETVFAKRELPPSPYKVQLPNGKFEGELEICLKFFPKVHHGVLEVHLMEAHGLLDTDAFGSGEPYAAIVCNKDIKKSKILEGSNPVWDEKFEFQVDSDIMEILIKLFDKDVFSDDPLGNATIPLHLAFTQGHVDPMKYKVFGKLGQPQGELSVALKFIGKE